MSIIPKVSVVPKIRNNSLYYDVCPSKEEWLNPFDRLFDEMFSSSNPELSKILGDSVFEKNAYPKVNIVDFDDLIEIQASAPGMSEQDINIEISNRTLTIYGSNQQNKNLESRFLKREIKTSSFKRSFSLSDNLDVSSVSAKMLNGMLYIKIPKLKPTPSKDFKVKVAINKG